MLLVLDVSLVPFSPLAQLGQVVPVVVFVLLVQVVLLVPVARPSRSCRWFSARVPEEMRVAAETRRTS